MASSQRPRGIIEQTWRSDTNDHVFLFEQDEPLVDSVTDFVRQQLVRTLRESMSDDYHVRPVSSVIHEITLMPVCGRYDEKAKEERTKTIRIYYLTDQGGHHTSTCRKYDCTGYASREEAIESEETGNGCCFSDIPENENVKWYDHKAEPLHHNLEGNQLDYLINNLQIHGDSGYTKRSLEHKVYEDDIIGTRIHHNSIFIRPDLEVDKIPSQKLGTTIRYHAETCPSADCPGSANPSDTLRYGFYGSRKCRSDLGFPFKQFEFTQYVGRNTFQLPEASKFVNVRDSLVDLPEYENDFNYGNRGTDRSEYPPEIDLPEGSSIEGRKKPFSDTRRLLRRLTNRSESSATT